MNITRALIIFSAVFATKVSAAVSPQQMNELAEASWDAIGALQACAVHHIDGPYGKAAVDAERTLLQFYRGSGLESENFQEVGIGRIWVARKMAAMELAASSAADKLATCNARIEDAKGLAKRMSKPGRRSR